MNLINCIIVLIATTFTTATAPPIEVVFFIQSQGGTKYENELSQNLKEKIIKEAAAELPPKYRIKVHVLHEIINYPGHWTIHNLIPQLMLFQRKSHSNRKLKTATTDATTTTDDTNTDANKQFDIELISDATRWIVFCEDRTRVKVKLLMEKLNNENHTQPLYLGHPLYDREPTIIHHFAFFENPKWFPYPMLRAGIVLSMPLFKSIADVYANPKHFSKQLTLLQRSEFSIDAAHELAHFIYDNVQISTVTTTTTAAATIPQTNKMKNINKNPHDKVFNNTIRLTNKPTRSAILAHSDIDVNSNVSDLSHSDVRTTTTDEIMGEKYSESCTNRLTATTTNANVKRQKIILKKASYICPSSTGETESRYNKENNNKNNQENEECALSAEQTTNAASSETCIPAKREEIYFAVKTCKKHHNERLPIIQSTWAPFVTHVKYFSDTEDDTIPTTNTGVPNVEMGHCVKTLQILKLALRDIENYNNKKRQQKQQQQHLVNQAKHENHQIQWLILTDDDTLLSVSGVCQVLGCYNSMDEIYVGERYGYRLYAQDGFNYITGGGGIAFSLPVVRLILQHCSCPSPSAPDDMILGSCLHSLQLRALHSPRFHQARPNDYSLELLKQEPPVSFHKFWQLDPVDVYNQWFSIQDRQLLFENNLVHKNLVSADNKSKASKMFTKTEPLSLNEIPVSLMASLHHSKERHCDL